MDITHSSPRQEFRRTGTAIPVRTYEIPACGGFIVHGRTPEALRLFEEGKQMAAYGSVEELAQEIDYYLAHPEERHTMAQAHHEGCVPGYSYVNRMQNLAVAQPPKRPSLTIVVRPAC